MNKVVKYISMNYGGVEFFTLYAMNICNLP